MAKPQKSLFILGLWIGWLLLASACSADRPAEELDTNLDDPIIGAVTETAELPAESDPAISDSERRSYAGEIPAPAFPSNLDWLNVDRPLTLEQLRGKVVLLDFWTYGCINCYHIIPDLKALEEEFDEELVVIGVHSAKFSNEGETENIRQIIRRYELQHPVVNDRDFEVWQNWGTNAWPTTILIDPAGKVVGGHSGEGVYQVLQPVIRSLVLEFDEKGALDRTPLALKLESEGLPETTLSFPGKVLVDVHQNRLFISDSNHNRIIAADPGTGEILQVYGSGEAGFGDGDRSTASFNKPQGLALLGKTLYVADTNNHAVRAIELETGQVTTLLGTGRQARTYPPRGGAAPGIDLSSPWDLAIRDSRLLIAMAGSHQIWSMDLRSGEAGALVGSGREGTRNAELLQSELAQPSGLALDETGRLYFADSESSSIRWADFESGSGRVGLLAGSDKSLFDFGDVDGQGDQARLQHPLGVVVYEGQLYIADTYNSKIKRASLETGEVQTILGDDQGWRDGSAPRFYEPGGLDAADGKLYIADTNNHAIRIVDLGTLDTRTLVLYGIERFEPASTASSIEKALVLEPVAAATGEVRLSLEFAFPAGYKLNPLAPSTIFWSTVGLEAEFISGSEQSIQPGTVAASVDLSEGQGSLLADVSLYYCESEKEALCLIDQVRLVIPLQVGVNGQQAIKISYSVPEPEF